MSSPDSTGASSTCAPSTPTDYPQSPGNTDFDPELQPPQCHPSVIDVLRIASLRGDLADVPHRIADAVSSHCSTRSAAPTTTADTLRVLMLCLSELGVDFAPAQQALAGPAIHCARCSRSYREADNDARACVVPHAVPLVTYCDDSAPGGGEDGGAFATRYYPCCGISVTAHPRHPGGGACYVGPHTSGPQAFEASQPLQAFKQHETDAGSLVPEPVALEPTPIGASDPQVLATPFNVVASVTTCSASTTVTSRAPTRAQYWQEFTRDSSPRGSVDDIRRPQAQSPDSKAPVPKILDAMPWTESSLYHPPGWVVIPPALRRWGDPEYV